MAVGSNPVRALGRTLWRVVRADLAWTLGVVMGGVSVAFFMVALQAGIDVPHMLKGWML